jgi:hypothetical protein
MTTASLPQFVSEHEHAAWLKWTSRVMSAIPVSMLAMSAVMKLTHSPDVVKMWTETHGFPLATLTWVALLELACAVLYAIPRSSVLGAILVAAYLGGAFSAHVRIDDLGGGVTPIALAVLAWGGLYLRDERVRALLPLRRPESL